MRLAVGAFSQLSRVYNALLLLTHYSDRQNYIQQNLNSALLHRRGKWAITYFVQENRIENGASGLPLFVILRLSLLFELISFVLVLYGSVHSHGFVISFALFGVFVKAWNIYYAFRCLCKVVRYLSSGSLMFILFNFAIIME